MHRSIACLALLIAPPALSAQVVAPLPAPPAGDVAVLLSEQPPRLAVFDNGAHALVDVLPTHPSANPPAALNVELAPKARHAYVLHLNGDVTRVELSRPGAPPVVISPDPTAIPPFAPIAHHDLELSPDGRYLVATAFHTSAWQLGLPGQLNRVSVYDLAAGTSAHFFIDQMQNPQFVPALQVAIAGSSAWIGDGDFNRCVAIDLATHATLASFPTMDPVTLGSASNLLLPTADLGIVQGFPCWLPTDLAGAPTYLRVGVPAAGTHVDFTYQAFGMRELEAGPSDRYVAITRPKTINLPGSPSTDQIVLFDLVAQLACKTPKIMGQHRFREIEFRSELAGGRVVGLDWTAQAFLIADFGPFLANPASGGCTLTSVPLPGGLIQVRDASDGLLHSSGVYVFHDGKSKLAWIDAQGAGQVLAVADAGFAPSTTSIDLELAGRVAAHRD